jgi:hypothetical protein
MPSTSLGSAAFVVKRFSKGAISHSPTGKKPISTSRRAQLASTDLETLCHFKIAAIQADTPRMTIRLSGEISAQITLEARKNTVSIEALVNRSRV